MNIKVTVDYRKGYYYVTGFKETPNGCEFSEMRKIISGTEDDGKTKYSYTDKYLIKDRKEEMNAAIRKIMKKNPKFKICKEALKKVDLLMFIALKRWDEQINNNSDYATKYLMAIIQEFDKKNSIGIPKGIFKEKCRKARENSLRKAGIDITYNVGMIGADDNLSILDRMIGVKIAKMQQKFLGVKVINKLVVDRVSSIYEDRSVYENLPNNFDIPEDFEDKIINKTMEQIKLQDSIKYEKEVQPEDDLLEFNGEDDIVDNIAMNMEKDRENGVFDIEEIEEENKLLEDDLLEFDGEDDIIDNIAMNIEKDRENGLFDIQEKIIPIEKAPSKRRVWTRKINNKNDSIKNKRFNPKEKKFKERVARLAISALATGGVAFAAYNATKIGEVFGENNNFKMAYEKQYTSNMDEIKSETKGYESDTNLDRIQTNKKLEKEPETKLISKVQSEKEKIEKFRQQAVKKYMDAFIVGEKPLIGNMLKGKTYSENPDGSGNIGYFDNHLDYKLEHITVITPERWHIVTSDGKSLAEILNEYPNYTMYNLHFSNSKTDGGLGFITGAKLERMINSEINSIIETKRVKNANNTIIQDNDQR